MFRNDQSTTFGGAQEAAARLALLREDCDVKLLDGVAVSLVDRRAHLALLHDWLLDLSRFLITPNAAAIAAAAPSVVVAELGSSAANPAQTLTRPVNGNGCYAATPNGALAFKSDANSALHRSTSALLSAAEAKVHEAQQNARFQYFVEKVCKIQVCMK